MIEYAASRLLRRCLDWISANHGFSIGIWFVFVLIGFTPDIFDATSATPFGLFGVLKSLLMVALGATMLHLMFVASLWIVLKIDELLWSALEKLRGK